MALIADFVTGKPVTFRRIRHLLAQMALQEGVVGAGDFKVAQRAASANMSVDVAAGEAWVAVDTGVRNGIAHLTNDAVANVVVPASDATNPTIHSVVAQYNDTAVPAGVGGDEPTLRLLAGTPTAGATLDNRNGAPPNAADAILFADILVPAASTNVVTANIRDRRRWARGANWSLRDTGPSITTTSLSLVSIGSHVRPRLEMSGVPIIITFNGIVLNDSAGVGARVGYDVTQDGSSLCGQWEVAAGASARRPTALRVDHTPPAGSRLFDFRISAVDGGTTTLSNAHTPSYSISEVIRPNAQNA